MSKSWIRSKIPVFVRDVIRDLCLVSQVLREQFDHFDRCSMVDFATLRDLLGEDSNRGLLWRLKDASHLLFRNEQDPRLIGQFLDWAIGYVFHETIKLKEDAYQQQNYGPLFCTLMAGELPGEAAQACSELQQVLAQTSESMEREIRRIRFILDQLARLMPVYLAAHRENALLARFLYEQNELVREVFGPEYKSLMRSIYGSEPERMFVLASQSLRQGGWMQDALVAVEEAMQVSPNNFRVLQEKEIVDNWRSRLKS